MYQQNNNNNENKRYNCSCGAGFATLKEYDKHNHYYHNKIISNGS
jgi:hypothetical protein